MSRLVSALLALASAVPATAAAWAPLTDARGRVLAWPADAWPLALADADAAWARAAVTWSRVGAVGFWPTNAGDATVTTRQIEDVAAWQAEVGDPALVAFTLVSDHDGELTGAAVLLNAGRFRFGGTPAAYDREAVLVHELGHAIGLGHPCGDGAAPSCFGLAADAPEAAAVMFPTLAPGAAPRAPNADDRAGVAAVVAREAPARAISLTGVTREAPGRWRVQIDGLRAGDAVRAWAAQRAEAAVSVEAGAARIESAATPPLDVEAWTPEGRGLYAAAALTGADAGAPAYAAPADGASTGDGGCAAAGTSSAAPWWMLAVLAPRRRRTA